MTRVLMTVIGHSSKLKVRGPVCVLSGPIILMNRLSTSEHACPDGARSPLKPPLSLGSILNAVSWRSIPSIF
jgi:hypothetical protein